MKANYFIIPAIVLAVMILGSSFTYNALYGWYDSINKPEWTPPGSIIGLAWSIIYFLAVASVLIFWNFAPRGKFFNLGVALLLINAFTNAFWSFFFFFKHFMGWAVVDSIIMLITLAGIMVLLWHWGVKEKKKI